MMPDYGVTLKQIDVPDYSNEYLNVCSQQY